MYLAAIRFNLVFCQNKDIFVWLDELDKFVKTNAMVHELGAIKSFPWTQLTL